MEMEEQSSIASFDLFYDMKKKHNFKFDSLK